MTFTKNLELESARRLALLTAARGALQQIADEAMKHHEYNPVSKKSRLPSGYQKILNIADAAIQE